MANITLTEKVYRELKNKIISADFNPGEPLVEENLVKIFNTSRTPIREAINRLEKEGLIKNFNYKGSFINILTIKEIKEIFQIRSALEILGIRLAINNVSEKELRMIERRFSLLTQGNEDVVAYERKLNELVMDFHRLVQKATQNDLLFSLMDNLYNRIEATKNFLLKSHQKTKRSDAASGHLKIIDALKRKNAVEAERLMVEHINKALNNMLNIL